MTAKAAKGARREVEIEKYRDESNWKKVNELATEQLKPRPPNQGVGDETWVNLLIGESKLEQFLEDNLPTEQNINKARTYLADAKRYLLSSLNGHSSKLGLRETSYMLLAKLHFAMGVYEEALNNLQNAGLDSITDKNIAHRTLKIVAESYAIRGLCYDKLPPQSTSKFQIAERDDQIIKCFETAGDLALLYLQERDRVQGQSTLSIISSTSGSTSPMLFSDESRAGPILETALQRAPILLIKQGRLSRAVTQYRNVLTAVEATSTQSLRLTLARQLAEVLLRGLSELVYEKPGLSVDVGNKTGSGSRISSTSDSPWKPRKYVGQNLFLPHDLNEEIILLLLICEAMAVREAVLSRLPEHKEARIHSFQNATAIYDLLTVALVRKGQVGVLCESFDRAMKFSFEEFHIWFQFGLALCSAGKQERGSFHEISSLQHYRRLIQYQTEETQSLYADSHYNRHGNTRKIKWEPKLLLFTLLYPASLQHARSVMMLKECARMEPNNALPNLMAAKICYEYLDEVDEGIAYALKALEQEKSHPQNLAARCHLILGLGYFLKSEVIYLQSERQNLLCKALDGFHRAQQLDPNDYLAEYFLALYFAQVRQISEAIQHVKLSLYLRNEHLNSLLLLVLLLSAQKQYHEALLLIEAAQEEYPENFNLLYIKAHLEEHCCGGEEALLTSKLMLRLWRATYEEQTQRELHLVERGRQTMIAPNVFQLYSSGMSDRDSSSLRANSVAASLVEHALSEVASSMSCYQPRPGPQQAWLLQIQIWLLLAKLYLKLDQLSEANACIQEASNIFPLSHHIMYMKGLIYEHKHNFVEAKKWYQNAVSINPTHVKSLQHLGLVLHYLGSNHIAEKILRDAAKIEPLSHKSWYNMGKVLEAMGEFESASECLATAIELEASCPILPFTTIPRSLE